MESLVDKIKLPSNWMLVNPDSIWRYLIIISKTGNTFNKDQLIKAGLYTNNEDNISRNLSYLKYLGFVEEERGKGKDQRFKVIDKTEIRDVIYELKANREDSAKLKLKTLLANHQLFRTLKDEFFKDEKNKTLNDLEHFLKDGLPGKTPQYIQKGGEFIIKLLKLTSLADIDGNDITLLENGTNKLNALEPLSEPPNLVENKNEISMEPLPAVQILKPKYSIKILGPDVNLDVQLKNVAQIAWIETLLQSIKTELENEL